MTSRPFIQCTLTLGYISSLLLLIAGASKSLDYSTFYNSLSEWRIIKSGAIATIAAMAPLLELILASLWLLRINRHLMNYFITLMIIAYTSALVWEYRVSGYVDCNCFANFLSEPESPAITWYIVRNSMIALPYVLLICFRSPTPKDPYTCEKDVRHSL